VFGVDASDASSDEELTPWAYVDDHELLDLQMDKHGVSREEAQENIEFQQGAALRIGDVLLKEFETELITTEVDPRSKTLIVRWHQLFGHKHLHSGISSAVGRLLRNGHCRALQ
jgi:hypothetical protein